MNLINLTLESGMIYSYFDDHNFTPPENFFGKEIPIKNSIHSTFFLLKEGTKPKAIRGFLCQHKQKHTHAKTLCLETKSLQNINTTMYVYSSFEKVFVFLFCDNEEEFESLRAETEIKVHERSFPRLVKTKEKQIPDVDFNNSSTWGV
jgi:hypothetical protein